jgi:hypothetical protein
MCLPFGSAHRERGMRIRNFELGNYLKNNLDCKEEKKIIFKKAKLTINSKPCINNSI